MIYIIIKILNNIRFTIESDNWLNKWVNKIFFIVASENPVILTQIKLNLSYETCSHLYKMIQKKKQSKQDSSL